MVNSRLACSSNTGSGESSKNKNPSVAWTRGCQNPEVKGERRGEHESLETKTLIKIRSKTEKLKTVEYLQTFARIYPTLYPRKMKRISFQ